MAKMTIVIEFDDEKATPEEICEALCLAVHENEEVKAELAFAIENIEVVQP